MQYRTLEGLTAADTAFEAEGSTVEELFIASAQALVNAMVVDLIKISERDERVIQLTAPTVEELLHDFLQSFLYFKDAEELLLLPTSIQIQESGGGFELKSTLRGEKINPTKHDLIVDVKAVTYHQFSVREPQGAGLRWRAVVVLDV